MDVLYQNNSLTSILFFYIIINKKLFRTTENKNHGEQFMKKTKRLLLLYVVAFVATVLDHTSDMRYWKAAVAATIIIPVLIWAYSFVYRLLKGSDDKESDDVTKKP